MKASRFKRNNSDFTENFPHSLREILSTRSNISRKRTEELAREPNGVELNRLMHIKFLCKSMIGLPKSMQRLDASRAWV